MSDEAETTGAGSRGTSRRRRQETPAEIPAHTHASRAPEPAEAETPAGDAKPDTQPDTQPAPELVPDKAPEPRFARERVLGPDGPRIAGHPAHVIAGALHGTDAADLTGGEIDDLVTAFLTRPAAGQGA